MEGPPQSGSASRVIAEPCPICTKQLPKLRAQLHRERSARTDAQQKGEAASKKCAALARKLTALQAALSESEQSLREARAAPEQVVDAPALKAAQAAAKASEARAAAAEEALAAQTARTAAAETQLRAAEAKLESSVPAAHASEQEQRLSEQVRALSEKESEQAAALAKCQASLREREAELSRVQEDFAAFRKGMQEFRDAANSAVTMHKDMALAVAQAATAAKQVAAREALVSMMRVCVVAPQVTLKLTRSSTVRHGVRGSAAPALAASDTHIESGQFTSRAPLEEGMKKLKDTISREVMPKFTTVYTKAMQAADEVLAAAGLGEALPGRGTEHAFQAMSDAEEAAKMSELCDRMATAVERIVAREFDAEVRVTRTAADGI